MTDTENLARRWILFFILLTLLTAAAGSIGVIWIKQQISVTAYENKKLERNLVDLQRVNSDLNAQVARLHTPNYLLARMRGMQLSLVPPSRDQLVWMDTGEMERTAYRREVAQSRDDRSPFLLSLDVALNGEGVGN